MFCASFSSTPQLVIGGRRPRPRKRQRRLAQDHAGIDSVAEAIRWLMKLGSRWRTMMRLGRAPISSRGAAKSSSRSASSLERTARARPGQSSRPRMMVMPK